MTTDKQRPQLICIGCGREPMQISIYVDLAKVEQTSAYEYVWTEEGTLNKSNGHFACDQCYISMGMPSSPTGWKAP